MTSLIGQTIGEKYQILSELGKGGMGTVYEARDLTLGRTVAIKALQLAHDADRTVRERFLREARSLAMLEHPNVLPIYELLDVGDTAYMVMQCIKGGSLKDVIQRAWVGEAPEGLPPAYVVTVIGQVARALDYAHNQGIVHRDIKPGNILLAEDDRALLADFGIAKWTDVTQESALTADGAAVGTPAFMSPEQINGRELGPQSDVYSLAIVVYQMLTGHVPFEGDTISVIYKQINEPPPPPTGFNDDIPPEVEQTLLKALEKDPTNRFARAGDFAGALQAAFAPVTGVIDVEKGSLAERLRESAALGRLARRRRREASEKKERGFLPRLLIGLARTLAIVVVALLLIAVALTGVASLLLSRVIENATAQTDWVLDEEYDITYTEDELSEMATNGVAFALPGLIEAIEISLEAPDGVSVTAERESGAPITLTGTLRLNSQGQPIVAIRRYNDVPLSLFGAMLSGGINRGFASALDNADGTIAEMTLSDDALALSIRSRSGGSSAAPAQTPISPTVTPSPTGIPTPVEITTGNADQVAQWRTLNEHSAGILALSWSPNGELLASGSADRSLILWNTDSWRTRNTMDYTEGVNNVVFSPTDARLAASPATGDGTIWGVASTGSDIPFTGSCVAWSPDGSTLSTCTSEGRIAMWDSSSGEPIRTLDITTFTGPQELAWLPDGQTLVVIGSSGAGLFNAETGGWPVCTLAGDAAGLRGVAVSPDGVVIAAGTSVGDIGLWNSQTCDLTLTLDASSVVLDLAWSPDGRMLAASLFDHTITLWDARTGNLVSALTGHENIARAVAWSPDGTLIASGDGDGVIILWTAIRP